MTLQKIQRALIFIIFGLSPQAQAMRPGESALASALLQCEVCQDEIHGDLFLCPSGHSTCADCISGHLGAFLNNPDELQAMRGSSLNCFHAWRLGATAHSCQHPIPFDTIIKFATDTQALAVHAILQAADSPPEVPQARAGAGTSPSDSDHEPEDAELDAQVTELRKKVEEAFMFSCPTCGSGAQEHDACCAVECGNRACKSYFCSLCFKKFATGPAGSTAAHLHVAHEHTGQSAYEFRFDEFDELDESGHPTRWSHEKRYQWLITRRKLDSILNPDMKPALRKALLHSIKKTYQGDYNLMIWPMPAGLPSSEWIPQVLADTKMPLKKKIWLLAMEGAYQREKGTALDLANADKIDSEVKKLGGQVIAKLDAPRVGAGGAAAPAAVNPHVTALMPGDRDPQIAAFRAALEQEHQAAVARGQKGFFSLGGEAGRLYRITDPTGVVPPFILSDLAEDADGNPLNMTHKEAAGWDDATGHHPGYCEARGAMLADRDQLEALGRAMRHGGRYNPDSIAGMRDTWFWSLSLSGGLRAYDFFGYNGKAYPASRPNDRHVRCVRVAAW